MSYEKRKCFQNVYKKTTLGGRRKQAHEETLKAASFVGELVNDLSCPQRNAQTPHCRAVWSPNIKIQLIQTA